MNPVVAVVVQVVVAAAEAILRLVQRKPAPEPTNPREAVEAAEARARRYGGTSSGGWIN